MSIPHNPFYYIGTIKESRLFIGRKREVAEICEAIGASASVSVVGERRVGKSSLMQYLADPTVKQKNGLQVARYVFAYFDFLGYPTITPTELWRRLLAQALSQLAPSPLMSNIQTLLEKENIELAGLELLMQNFKDVGLNLVILFDEFDAAAANPNFDQAFFGGLRNLSKYPLSYIVASHRTLSDLRFAHPDALISPFFNFFRRVTLGGFTREEVETLINVSLQGTSVAFDAPDRELLNALAGSHPFFLQTAAYFLFDAYRYDYRQEGRADYRWVQDRVRDNSVEHFRYYWNEAEAGEKLILSTLSLLDAEELARYQLYPRADDPMLRRLRERVLVMEDKIGSPRVFSSLFKQWIAETISFMPVKNAADFKAALEKAKVRGFQKAWLDTTERIRKGFAWIDVRAVSNWLIKAKGAEGIVDLITKLLQLIR
jgi:hypothetical protein